MNNNNKEKNMNKKKRTKWKGNKIKKIKMNNLGIKSQ